MYILYRYFYFAEVGEAIAEWRERQPANTSDPSSSPQEYVRDF